MNSRLPPRSRRSGRGCSLPEGCRHPDLLKNIRSIENFRGFSDLQSTSRSSKLSAAFICQALWASKGLQVWNRFDPPFMEISMLFFNPSLTPKSSINCCIRNVNCSTCSFLKKGIPLGLLPSIYISKVQDEPTNGQDGIKKLTIYIYPSKY